MTRVYAWLLRCYPRDVRERHGAAMAATFALELESLAGAPALARARFWTITVVEAVVFGWAARVRGGFGMRALVSLDVASAWRALKTTPVVTAAAVLSLALGIGGSTALFSILNGLTFKKLPVAHPERLVLLDEQQWTNPIWEALRPHRKDVAADAFAWASVRFDLSDAGVRDDVTGAFVSGGAFDALGLTASAGRLLTEADDVRGGPGVAVISHALWRQRFGGAGSAIGSVIRVNRQPFTIVGVLPARFFGMDVGTRADVVVPIAAKVLIDGPDHGLDERARWWLDVYFARRPDQSIEDLAARLNALRPGLREATMPPDWMGLNRDRYLADPFVPRPAAEGGSDYRGAFVRPLTLLLGLVGIVLVIACANIANLLVARAAARRHELAVRLALGASRGRIVRHLLVETLLLTGLGVVTGMAVAVWGSRWLVSQVSASIALDLGVDWRVLAFTALTAAIGTLIFGVGPSVLATRIHAGAALREAGRSIAGPGRRWGRSGLVVLQVALSLTIVVGAGLFFRSLYGLAHRPLGFETDGLTVVGVRFGAGVTGDQARFLEIEQLAAAARATPGVTGASASVLVPLVGGAWNSNVDVDGGPVLTGRERMAWLNAVTAGWFDAMGLPLLAGRDIATADREGMPRVAVVNEMFVRKFIGDGPAVGRTLKVDGPFATEPITIVGVVQDAVYRTLRRGVEPTVFLSVRQADRPGGGVQLVVRSGLPLPDVKTAVSSRLLAVDPRAAFQIRTFASYVASQTVTERMTAVLSVFFGGLALLLAAIGLYGITSHSVTERRGDIAVRLALGATPVQVMRGVLGRALTLVALGLAAGLILCAWAGRYIESLLFGVAARDAMTWGAAVVVLLCVGVTAAWWPARRATRLDPTDVLRA